jgi:hypothetical protein
MMTHTRELRTNLDGEVGIAGRRFVAVARGHDVAAAQGQSREDAVRERNQSTSAPSSPSRWSIFRSPADIWPAPELRVPRAVAYAASAERRDDFVRAEAGAAGRQGHGLSEVVRHDTAGRGHYAERMARAQVDHHGNG